MHLGMIHSGGGQSGRLVAVAVLLAFVSCSDGAVQRTLSTVTDSAGIPIAYTRIGQDAAVCRVSEEVFRIGSDDGSEGALFGVNGVISLGDGRVAVVNRGTSQIKLFSPQGGWLGAFGRQGGGPDEFKNLWSIHLRGQDTLVVADYRPWRFSFFMPAGQLVRRVELKPAVIERPDFAMPLAAGAGFMMEEPLFQVQDQMVDRVVPLYLYGEDGALADTLGEFWLDEFGTLVKEIRYVGNPIFGARASFSYLGDDLILYGTGRYEQLEIWATTGELQRIIRWQSRDRTVSPGDADEWRRQRRQQIFLATTTSLSRKAGTSG
jgi:hypothetical protein